MPHTLSLPASACPPPPALAPRQSINVQHDGVYLYRHVLVPGLPGLAFVGAEVSTFNNILTAALQVCVRVLVYICVCTCMRTFVRECFGEHSHGAVGICTTRQAYTLAASARLARPVCTLPSCVHTETSRPPPPRVYVCVCVCVRQAEWLASALAGEVELPLPHAMAADVEAQMEWRRRTMPPHKLRGSSVMLYMQVRVSRPPAGRACVCVTCVRRCVPPDYRAVRPDMKRVTACYTCTKALAHSAGSLTPPPQEPLRNLPLSATPTLQAYHDQLVRDMGAATHRKQPSFRHPFAECFEPYTALDYSDVFMRDPLKVAASGAALAQAAAVPTAAAVAVGRATAAAALAANGTVDNGTDESNAANGTTVEAAAAAVAAAANATAGTATSPTVLGTTNNASCSAAASSGAYFTSLRASNSTGAQWAPCRTSTLASNGLGGFSNYTAVHSNSNGGPNSGAGPSPVRPGGAPGATATAAASNIYTNKTIAGLAAISARNGMGASNVRSPPWIYAPMAAGAIAAAAALQPATTQAAMPNAAARAAAGATMSGSRPPLVAPQRTASFTPASAFTSAATANAAAAAQTLPPNAAATAAAAGVLLGMSPRHGGHGTGTQQHHHNVPLDPLAPSEIDEDEPKARAVDEQVRAPPAIRLVSLTLRSCFLLSEILTMQGSNRIVPLMQAYLSCKLLQPL